MSPICPVIPVLDLMIGQIVLASGGKRDSYQPVNSKLCRSSRPLNVAQSIHAQTGCETIYLADIDSFAGAEPNWKVYQELLDHGCRLWVDAAWLQADRLSQLKQKLPNCEGLKVIVSTESLDSLDQLHQVEQIREAGVEPIFSLDQHCDSIITRNENLKQLTPLEWIHHAYQFGFRELILLDLAGVGTMRGFIDQSPQACLIQEIRAELPQTRIISGGGVRSPDDVAQMLTCGCSHVLVASAIHQCSFTHGDIERLQELLVSAES